MKVLIAKIIYNALKYLSITILILASSFPIIILLGAAFYFIFNIGKNPTFCEVLILGTPIFIVIVSIGYLIIRLSDRSEEIKIIRELKKNKK